MKEERANRNYKSHQSKVGKSNGDKVILSKKHKRENRFRCCLYAICVIVLLAILATLLTFFVLFGLRPGFELELKTNQVPLEPLFNDTWIGDVFVARESVAGLVDGSQFSLNEVKYLLLKERAFKTGT